MRLFDLRKRLKTDFVQRGIDAVDVDFIVASVLGVSHMELTLIDEVVDKDLDIIMECVDRRILGEPVNKIFEKAYFYGREYKIDHNVLAPRQDSEILIEAAVKFIRDNGYKNCLDLCTGSGCLAITIKLETGIVTEASDISTKALKVARENAKRLKADVDFIKSNMFDNIDNMYDIIISNPPYIASDDIEDLDIEVRTYDPILALDGGELGLKYYNIIHDNLRKHLNPNGMCILEIGDDQRLLVESLFADFHLVECLQDLGGNDRVLVFKI